MTQLVIPGTPTVINRKVRNATENTLLAEDEPVHDWYRFVLSFPPHLVRQYVTQFDLGPNETVLDPFCGTGTTLVEAKKLGIGSVGTEAVGLSAFAASTKTSWSVDPVLLRKVADSIANKAEKLEQHRTASDPDGSLNHLLPEAERLLIKNSISPLPLHKCLILRDLIDCKADPSTQPHLRLALAASVVQDASNLHFGPEVGVGKIRKDAHVFEGWVRRVHTMAKDLECVRDNASIESRVYQADSRSLDDLPIGQVDAVITSPPYPNEKDYTRTVRLESVLLGLIDDKIGLRQTKKQLVRSNTRSVYKDDSDDVLINGFRKIIDIADSIEARRIELGKTSGFEKLYPRVTRLYFGGMLRHLQSLIPALKPGARLAYVVGDQASYLRVHIRTGQLLAEIAESIGFQIDSIDLFRTRRATVTKAELREETVVMTWPGQSHAR